MTTFTPERVAQIHAEVASNYPDLYRHPDGADICYSRSTAELWVSLDEFNEVQVPISADGLIELGLKLIQLGHEINTAWALKEVA